MTTWCDEKDDLAAMLQQLVGKIPHGREPTIYGDAHVIGKVRFIRIRDCHECTGHVLERLSEEQNRPPGSRRAGSVMTPTACAVLTSSLR